MAAPIGELVAFLVDSWLAAQRALAAARRRGFAMVPAADLGATRRAMAVDRPAGQAAALRTVVAGGAVVQDQVVVWTGVAACPYCGAPGESWWHLLCRGTQRCA